RDGLGRAEVDHLARGRLPAVAEALVLDATVESDVGLDPARPPVGDVRVQTDLLVQRENGPLERTAVGERDVEELRVVVGSAGEAHRETVDAALTVRRIRASVWSFQLVPDGDLRDAGLADVDPTVEGARAPERRLEKGLDLRPRGIEHQAGK